MFSRRRSREIEDFAISLAQEFARRCPPDGTQDRERTTQVAKAIDDTCNKAANFQREHGLWMYGRAKFGTAFKIELKQKGYPAEFVSTLTTQMLLNMSGK
jgi:hypothetical protein